MAERSRLVVAAPLRIEAVAVRPGVPGATVLRAGMRARRAARVRAALESTMDAALAVIGVAGALTTGLRPGDLVVADQVHSTRGFWYCPAAPLLAEQLRRTGLTVHVATVLESDRLVGAAGRAALAVDGAVAVDMESARLLELAGGHPAVVLRSIVDTPAHGPMHPATVPAGLRALAALRRAGPGLLAWASDPGGHPTRHDPPAPPTTGDPAGPDHPREVRHR